MVFIKSFSGLQIKRRSDIQLLSELLTTVTQTLHTTI